MKFELNDKETATLQKAIESLSFLVGEPDSLSRTFIFTPTPIGIIVKVELTARVGEEKTQITKDITDYESW